MPVEHLFHCDVKERDESEPLAEGSQTLLSQLPLSNCFTVEEDKSSPIDTSAWFEQSMYYMICIS